MPFFQGVTSATSTASTIACTAAGSTQLYVTQATGGLLGTMGTAATASIFIAHSIQTNSTFATNVIGGYVDGWFITNGEYVIDEEDYVNHAEYFELARQRGIAFRIRTAEEKRLAEEAAARARAERERHEQERRVARERSRELLLANLTAAQRETFEKNRWFIVKGGKSGREYRIRDNGVAGNIDIITHRGSVEARLCCHCRHDIPDYDQYLAQKLALQWDEESFLKLANRHAA